jgi:hypothetical protein
MEGYVVMLVTRPSRFRVTVSKLGIVKIQTGLSQASPVPSAQEPPA